MIYLVALVWFPALTLVASLQIDVRLKLILLLITLLPVLVAMYYDIKRGERGHVVSRRPKQRIVTATANKTIIKMHLVKDVLSPVELKRLAHIIDKLKEYDNKE